MTALALTASALQAEALSVQAAVAAVAALPISTVEQVNALGAGIGEIKSRLKFLEASRKERTAGLLAEVETIRAEYRPAETAYAQLEIATKARMKRYNEDTRAAAEMAQQAALASQQAAHAAAQAGRQAEAVALQQASFQAITAAPEVVKTAGIGSRFEWRVRVVDASKVPRQYLVVDEAAILRDVRASLPKAEAGGKVPDWAHAGVEIFLNEVIVAR